MKPEDNLPESIQIGEPQIEDAKLIYALVKKSPPLELNSLYSYLLVCSHFDDTSAVALGNENIVGYISAYSHPHKDDTLFIWQVAVHPSFRGKGLAQAMILDILGRDELRDMRYLETTITPSNDASRAFFKKLASYLGVNCHSSSFFTSSLFGETSHEEEFLIRMGPLNDLTDLR